jgi:hypothetical protein
MTVGSQMKQTLASLKGAQGTIRLYAAQARKEETRDAFRQASKTLDDIIIDMEGRLSTLEFSEPQYKGF